MRASQKDVRVESRGWRRWILAPVLMVTSLGLLIAPGPAEAKERFDQTLAGIAIEGYDPVAYFTQSKAVKGSDKFAYNWLGATWHFAKAEHRELFIGDPISYAPQYGGYCTSGIVGEDLHSANPKVWRIIDGKLYLNGAQYGLEKLAESATEGIEASDAKWEKLEEKLTH